MEIFGWQLKYSYSQFALWMWSQHLYLAFSCSIYSYNLYFYILLILDSCERNEDVHFSWLKLAHSSLDLISIDWSIQEYLEHPQLRLISMLTYFSSNQWIMSLTSLLCLQSSKQRWILHVFWFSQLEMIFGIYQFSDCV